VAEAVEEKRYIFISELGGLIRAFSLGYSVDYLCDFLRLSCLPGEGDLEVEGEKARCFLLLQLNLLYLIDASGNNRVAGICHFLGLESLDLQIPQDGEEVSQLLIAQGKP
jgi:hypothetical protein